MKSNHPDIRTMLPSKAQEYLQEYILNRMYSDGLNFYANPCFNKDKAFEELLPIHATTKIIVDAYQEAIDKFDIECPKCWDNEKQKAYRLIKGIKVFAK